MAPLITQIMVMIENFTNYGNKNENLNSGNNIHHPYYRSENPNYGSNVYCLHYRSEVDNPQYLCKVNYHNTGLAQIMGTV